MKCDICNIDVIIPDKNTVITDSRNIAVKRNDKLICNACSESLMFFIDISEVKRDDSLKSKKTKKDKVHKVKNTSKPKYICMKCKVSYEGSICKDCKTPNPLFVRKKVKKKRR